MRNKIVVFTLGLVLTGALFGAMACGGGGGKNSNSNNTPKATQPRTTQPQGTGEASPTGPAGAATSAQPTAAETAPAASTEGYDPCTLVTMDDAVAALGEDVADGDLSAKTTIAAIPGVNVTAQSCGYDSTTTGHSVSIDLWSVAADDASKLKDGVDQVVCAGKEKIADLGQSACWYSTAHDELQVVQDAAFLDLTISKGGTAVDQELLKIARSAVQRLD